MHKNTRSGSLSFMAKRELAFRGVRYAYIEKSFFRNFAWKRNKHHFPPSKCCCVPFDEIFGQQRKKKRRRAEKFPAHFDFSIHHIMKGNEMIDTKKV